MAIEIRRSDDELWPAVRVAVKTLWREDHPVLDRALFNWQYRGYGDLDDGGPWAFVALDRSEVISFVGLIPGMIRHRKLEGAVTRPQAFVGLWFTAPRYRSTGVGAMLMREAGRQVEVFGSLGVNDVARDVFARLGFDRAEPLGRWVAPLTDGYRELLANPSAADRAALAAWSARIADVPPAHEAELDPEGLAAIAANEDVGGLWRTARFYDWRYRQSVGFRYRSLGCDDGLAVVRVEQPALPDTMPVARVIELLPNGDAVRLTSSVLAWARCAGCCAADHQVSVGDPSEPSLARAGLARSDRHVPATSLAELFRPYRPSADRINVVFRPDPDDSGPWRFLKSDGDMDRTNEPYRGPTTEGSQS